MIESPSSTGQKDTRILIVDDHPWVRMGLASLIRFNKELVLCGEAADVKTAMRLTSEANPLS